MENYLISQLFNKGGFLSKIFIIVFVILINYPAKACVYDTKVIENLIKKPETIQMALIGSVKASDKSSFIFKVEKSLLSPSSSEYILDHGSDCSASMLETGHKYLFISPTKIYSDNPNKFFAADIDASSGRFIKIEEAKDLIKKIQKLKHKKR